MQEVTTVIKAAAKILFPIALTLVFSACGGTDFQEEVSEDILTGSWSVVGVQSDEQTIPLSQNPALADLYDTHILTINNDGTYSSMEGILVKKGTWTITLTEDDYRTYTFSETSAGFMTYENGEVSVNDEPSSGEYWVCLNTQNPDTLVKMEKEDADIILVCSRDEETPSYSEGNSASVPQSTPSQESTVQTPSATRGEMNALDTAKSYLRVSAFSYSGLIDQLEYEGYSHSEAVYGADHCGADWYDQAAKCAAQYLDVMSFSRQGLIEQLEYEGFTYDQAVHGVDQVY